MKKQFHPLVYDWFKTAVGDPTEVQEKAWPAIKGRKHTLIAAPTGSGKTLAAFFSVIDDLVQKQLNGGLSDKTQVIYVSPLKALSNDIEKNLRSPLKGIKDRFKIENGIDIEISMGLRTGDTSTSQRTAMFKKPPHILVSTPESLYLLLTSDNGRNMLSEASTIIVDEIHALVGNKRGSHLTLSLERLDNLSKNSITRIGLSATQKPLKKVASFLVGNKNIGINKNPDCNIIDTGLNRKLDLSLELPRSPLMPVMANEVWEEVYDTLENLIKNHNTTLIFVNTRRLAERMAHNLSNRLGDGLVTSHHGSMSKEHRIEAEQNLKSGKLKALIATASLELGIDIGSIDLVCQIGSPRSISGVLQRVGRSGHTIKGTPKGKLFPLSRDELIECIAIIDAVNNGILDEIFMPEQPLDILSQQIVAELSCREYQEDELYKLFNKAFPYRNLTREDFDKIINMLAEGYTTRRGRRGSYIFHDVVNEKLKARKGARITALVSGGAIPDNFDYDVVMEPANTFIGTLNEDFSIESMPGDIFQLGNKSYRILRIENGKVRVEDAKGAPPTIPFWFGEAPGRTHELSEGVSKIRKEISEQLGPAPELTDSGDKYDQWTEPVIRWLHEKKGIDHVSSEQAVSYLASVKAAIGEIPTRKNLIMERFFDEAGDMHLVIHSPFGSRLNRAWGLALRKRFCRKFNFELQAAATEDNIILSLGATHSFKIDEVYHYLNPKTVRDVLIQALLDAPMFEVRWRWNATRSLAIPRRRGNKKVPPQIQRSQAEDLVALVFPDQLACLENVVGEREIPNHPLVKQTIHDCLTEAMDIDELEKLLSDIKLGNKKLHGKDLREPSPMAQEILSARPYAFLDNAPLEERRTNAVQSRGWLDPKTAREMGHLDNKAIENVKSEVWPHPRDEDELHDALVLFGFFTETEAKKQEENWISLFELLIHDGRVSRLITSTGKILWIPIERISQAKAVWHDAEFKPELKIPSRLKSENIEPENAMKELVRGRLELLGPVIADHVADSMSLPVTKVEQALMALENEGFVIRGHFTEGLDETEWCDRSLLARIHRYTLQKLRKEIEPVSSAVFMQFLFQWQGITNERMEGPDSLTKVLDQLEGYEAPAASWESDIIPSRVKDYDFFWLDVLCLSGKLVWGRLRNQSKEQDLKNTAPIKTTPVTLIKRQHIAFWQQVKDPSDGNDSLTKNAKTVLGILKKEGASFFDDLLQKSELLQSQLEDALSELVSAGKITSDSFTGLRALLVPIKYKTGNRRKKKTIFTMEQAGRWTLLEDKESISEPDQDSKSKDENIEDLAMIFLKRYGIVFRKLIEKEDLAPPWRNIVRIYRLLEARGVVRGGRFVDGVSGEQFALPEAIPVLRKFKKVGNPNKIVVISGADPLNLTGIITNGPRVPGYINNRILFKNGEPIAIKDGDGIKYLQEYDKKEKWQLHTKLIRREIPPKLRSYLGKGIN